MKKNIVSIFVISLITVASLVSVNAANIEVENVEIQFEQNIPYDNDDLSSWTVIAYIDGDNNLNQIMFDTLNYMELVGSTKDIEVVAQWDGLQHATKRYHLTYDEDIERINSELVDYLGESNMGESETLSDFLIWAIENYPADRYLVILCNHGYSWGGICIDQTDDRDYLSLDELKTAFDKTNQRLKETQPWKDEIDLVLFEACTMSSIEVYYNLKDCFDLGVSCEHMKTTHPHLFTSLLENMTQHPEWDQTVVAEKIAKDYVEYAKNEGDEFEDDMEVIDPSNIDILIEKIDSLAVLLIDKLPLYKNLIKHAALNTGYQFTGPGNINSDYYHIFSYDLYQFASNLKKYIPNTPIKDAAQDVMNTIDEVVIKWFSDYNNKRGLHIMLHCFPDIDTVPEEYYELDFAEDTKWDEFVNKFLESLKKQHETIIPKAHIPSYVNRGQSISSIHPIISTILTATIGSLSSLSKFLFFILFLQN